MEKQLLKETILKRIERPQIPNRIYSVLEFGVIPDSEQIQTTLLQNAIDMVHQRGGGKLVLPNGSYHTGALRLKSQVELHLESSNTILAFANESPQMHYPLVLSHWEATPCYNFSSCIYACDEKDIAVTGEGVLNAGADKDHWWNWHHQVENAWSDNRQDLQFADRMLLRKMNRDGVPIEQRIFGSGHYLRPNFIQTIRCERVLFQGFTLKNSPMWQINPVLCKSVTVDSITMSSHGSNNDGCDPESCDGVHICNCRFDTGDDCISLKSGRDRDGRIAKKPCENVLIEKNEFIDGHGGIALGSEMSGGIYKVLAVNNHFSSPNLTYALRLKSNAKRGGRVEDIILADSVIESVHGAAVHGTMLYEDGRNGQDLPIFQNIMIENITASGGDYGIFLEAFDEVPITGLVLRNIWIDSVNQKIYGRNWKDPVIENVVINKEKFPRPSRVRILDVPIRGSMVTATAENCGTEECLSFIWQTFSNENVWQNRGEGEQFFVPKDATYLRVVAVNPQGETELGRCYLVLEQQEIKGKSLSWQRLVCRGMLEKNKKILESEKITRQQLAEMLMSLANQKRKVYLDKIDKTYENLKREEGEICEALQIAVENDFLPLVSGKYFLPNGYINRQEMATVAMQACGVNYRNASSTMPVCADVEKVSNNYGTNVARALYFGFLKLEENGCFEPKRFVTMKEAMDILNRVADFAGI